MRTAAFTRTAQRPKHTEAYRSFLEHDRTNKVENIFYFLEVPKMEIQDLASALPIGQLWYRDYGTYLLRP